MDKPMTDLEQLAKILADNWRNMHTNESLGKQRMLAQAIINAGWTPPPQPTTPSYLEN